MKNLIAKLKELETRNFDVVNSRGSLALQQTQRNKAKAEIVEALFLDIKEALAEEGYMVYQTATGPILEFLNRGVEEQIAAKGGSDYCPGTISIQLDAVMKNLDIDGSIEEADYLAEAKAKAEKEAKREREKQAKIQRDAELRAEKTRRREEEIARAQILRERLQDEQEG